MRDTTVVSTALNPQGAAGFSGRVSSVAAHLMMPIRARKDTQAISVTDTAKQGGWTDASDIRVARNTPMECLEKSSEKTNAKYGDPTIPVVNLEVV